MAANVQEWTSSDFVAYPGNTARHVQFDPNKKVVRGTYYGGNDFLARCSMRFCAYPGVRGEHPASENYRYIGFRCVMDLE
jgi:formylglycine-generating enzyme required for sulfatase activity